MGVLAQGLGNCSWPFFFLMKANGEPTDNGGNRNPSDSFAYDIQRRSSRFLKRMQALPMFNFFPVFAHACRNRSACFVARV